MLFITTGFAVFFIHALITIPELFSDTYWLAITENVHLFIHMIALVLIDRSDSQGFAPIPSYAVNLTVAAPGKGDLNHDALVPDVLA